MAVPENCLIMHNCGLYDGEKKSDRKNEWKNIRIFFQSVNDSLYMNINVNTNVVYYFIVYAELL